MVQEAGVLQQIYKFVICGFYETHLSGVILKYIQSFSLKARWNLADMAWLISQCKYSN